MSVIIVYIVIQVGMPKTCMAFLRTGRAVRKKAEIDVGSNSGSRATP